MNRRDFSATTLGFGLATILSNAASVRSAPANEKIRLGFIGCGGRGCQLMQGFLERDDIQIVHCADPVPVRRENARKTAQDMKHSPTISVDYRDVLADKNVDAVVNATPDHWHALVAIQSCQAGKDVYTEKPASHSAWEGRQMVQAARKYQRVVQHGTQNRSAPYNIAAKKYLDEGKLGRIHFARVYNMKFIPNSPFQPPTTPPPTLNWDLWNGPAPDKPYSPTYLSAWNHFWDYSSGDMINDGIHQIDLIRWLLGKELPKSVYCVGGRFDSVGAAQSPDTQVVTYEYDGFLMTFELTLYTPYMLKTDPVVRNSDMFPYWLQNATRIEIYGSDGMMEVGRHGGGWQVFDRPKDRQPVVRESSFGRFPDPEHKENFLQCMRSRQRPNSDIEEAHRSTLLAHYATVSQRLGGVKLIPDPASEGVMNNTDAGKFLRRTYRTPYVVPDDV